MARIANELPTMSADVSAVDVVPEPDQSCRSAAASLVKETAQ